MRRKIAFLSIFLVLITITTVPLYAQMKKLGQTGFKFLDVEVGARATGMGEAFTTIGTGANAIFFNPAGIAQMEADKFEITFCRTDWLAETSLDAFALVYNLGILGKLGFSLVTTDFGNIAGTTVNRETEQGYDEIGNLDLGAYAAGISYARALTDKFMIGGNVRYAREKLGTSLFSDSYTMDSTWLKDNKASALSFDMGTLFYPGLKSFRVGMCIRSYSPQVKYEEDAFQLPLTFHVAIGMDILDFFGEHPDQSFLVDFELVHPRDYIQRYHLGGEFSYKGMFFLRGGYKFNYDEEGLCAGVGFRTGGIILDYSYSDFGVFDFVNRVSLGVSF
jgi:hypothetical protein